MSQTSATRDSISEAIEKHANMVRRICFLYLRNHADVEDVFQEVFLKFFLNYDSFVNEEHQRAWLCQVTFNKCKDLCKSFWRKKVVSIEEMEIPYESPEQVGLMKAVLGLPPDQKEVIYLHYYENRTIPEIAAVMEKNSNTVYSVLRRGKAALKKKAGEMNW